MNLIGCGNEWFGFGAIYVNIQHFKPTINELSIDVVNLLINIHCSSPVGRVIDGTAGELHNAGTSTNRHIFI
jgi:hypothetical protein